MTELLTEKLWPTIKNLFDHPDKVQVAVAYLGKEALKFNWKKDDILVVSLTKKNILDEVVDVETLEELIYKGVQVFSFPKLHAKVYLFKKLAVIGSANLSWNSKQHLSEAAIITDDSKVLEDVKNFIEQLIHPDHQLSIEKLKEYKIPTIWFLKTSNAPPNEKRDEKVKDKDSYIKADPSLHNSYLKVIGVNQPSHFGIQDGDLVITLHEDKELYPPRKCYSFEEVDKKTYGADKLLFLITHSSNPSINWSNVNKKTKNLLSKEGEVSSKKTEVLRDFSLLQLNNEQSY